MLRSTGILGCPSSPTHTEVCLRWMSFRTVGGKLRLVQKNTSLENHFIIHIQYKPGRTFFASVFMSSCWSDILAPYSDSDSYIYKHDLVTWKKHNAKSSSPNFSSKYVRFQKWWIFVHGCRSGAMRSTGGLDELVEVDLAWARTAGKLVMFLASWNMAGNFMKEVISWIFSMENSIFVQTSGQLWWKHIYIYIWKMIGWFFTDMKNCFLEAILSSKLSAQKIRFELRLSTNEGRFYSIANTLPSTTWICLRHLEKKKKKKHPKMMVYSGKMKNCLKQIQD